MDIYEPTGTSGPTAAILYVHGGGWKGHCKEIDAFTTRVPTILQSGFTIFAVDFRIACDPSAPPPGVPAFLCGYRAPQAVRDVFQAIKWVLANASRYGADGTKVAVWGTSSGGNVALMASMGPSPHPAAVVAWSGPADLPLYSTSPDPMRLYNAATNYIGEGCADGICPPSWTTASPVSLVSADDPPTLVVNSDNEFVPVAGARELAADLLAHGVANELCVPVGVHHAWQVWGDVCPSDGHSVADDTLAWIHSTLGV